MSLPDTTLIALTGPAGSGKDTAAAYLVHRYGFVQASFAEPIRQMLFALFEHADIDHAYITEPSRKNTGIAEFGPCGISARTLMQSLGTEWGRQTIGNTFWVGILARHLGMPGAPVHDRIVISDLRFPEEAQWCIHHGATVCHVRRTCADPAVPRHDSERHFEAIARATPAAQFAELDNTGTLGQLHTRIDALMHERGIAQRDGLDDLTPLAG